jgi:DNA topoisomerase IA
MMQDLNTIFILFYEKYMTNNNRTKYMNAGINDNIIFFFEEKEKEENDNIEIKTEKSTNKMTQEAHEAIRPTNIERTTLDEKFSTKSKKVYHIIFQYKSISNLY